MLNSKSGLVDEMKELQGIVKMYQEAYPDNPNFQTKKDKKAKKGA